MCYSIQMILKARPSKFLLYHQGTGVKQNRDLVQFFQPMTSQLLHFDESVVLQLLKRNVAGQNFVTLVNTCSLGILKELIWSPFKFLVQSSVLHELRIIVGYITFNCLKIKKSQNVRKVPNPSYLKQPYHTRTSFKPW